jgi:hypothetical protein
VSIIPNHPHLSSIDCVHLLEYLLYSSVSFHLHFPTFIFLEYKVKFNWSPSSPSNSLFCSRICFFAKMTTPIPLDQMLFHPPLTFPFPIKKQGLSLLCLLGRTFVTLLMNMMQYKWCHTTSKTRSEKAMQQLPYGVCKHSHSLLLYHSPLRMLALVIQTSSLRKTRTHEDVIAPSLGSLIRPKLLRLTRQESKASCQQPIRNWGLLPITMSLSHLENGLSNLIKSSDLYSLLIPLQQFQRTSKLISKFPTDRIEIIMFAKLSP